MPERDDYIFDSILPQKQELPLHASQLWLAHESSLVIPAMKRFFITKPDAPHNFLESVMYQDDPDDVRDCSVDDESNNLSVMLQTFGDERSDHTRGQGIGNYLSYLFDASELAPEYMTAQATCIGNINRQTSRDFIFYRVFGLTAVRGVVITKYENVGLSEMPVQTPDNEPQRSMVYPVNGPVSVVQSGELKNILVDLERGSRLPCACDMREGL